MSTQTSITRQQRGGKLQSAAGAATGGSPFYTINFKDVMGILRRHIWLIIITTIIFMIISGVLWFVLKKYCPRYTATGIVECIRAERKDLYGVDEYMPRKDVVSLAVQNTRSRMLTDTFLNRLATSTEVKTTDWYKERANDPKKRLDDLKDDFRVIAQRNTSFVWVQMSAPNKEDAKIIVNAALTLIRTDQQETADAGLNKSLESLKTQQRQIQNNLSVLKSRLREQNNLIDAPSGGGAQTVVWQEVRLLYEEQLRLEAEIKQLEIYKTQLLEERKNSGQSSNVLLAIQQDPLVLSYQNQKANFIQQRDILLKRLGENHRQVKDMQAAIQTVQAQLDQRMAMLEEQYGLQEISNINDDINSKKQQLENIRQLYQVKADKQRAYEKTMSEIMLIRDEIRLAEDHMAEVNRYITAAGVKKGNSDRVGIRIHLAGTPLEISFPRLKIFLPVGLLLGLLVALGLTFLLEFLNDSVQSPRDVARYLDVPLLGMIPELDPDEEPGAVIEKISYTHPSSIIAEFFREIRTNIFYAAPAEELKTIFITSPAGGAGKTTTAVNLAISLASESKRVLLVDANFRKPALNRLFPADGPMQGLSNILVGHNTVADVLRKSGIENLDLIDCGPLPPSPADLVSSKRMQDFLDSQRQHYDYIILDGPPVLIVTDAKILAGLVDGTIAVIRAEQTSRGMAQRMIRELKNNKVRLLGVMLNEIRPHKGGYFAEAFQSYHEYVSVEPVPVGALPEEAGKNG